MNVAVVLRATPATDPGPVDGDFGPKTEAAAKAYQQDRLVEADGIVGDQTWWVPASAAGLLLRRCRDLRRCDFRVLGNELGYIKPTACNTLATSVDREPGSATPATTTDQLSD